MTDDTEISVASAVASLAQLALGLSELPSPDEALRVALDAAVDVVPGCEQAGVSMKRGSRIDTPASFGSLASACDKLQEELGDGPCVTALLENDVIRIDDVETDDRWPEFARTAAELGLRSLLACRIPTPGDRLGALNMYSTRPHAFGTDSEVLAVAYTTHIGIALSSIDKEHNLRRALESREAIGQAMGILMERHRITASQAFDLMVHVSQQNNVKLRAVADELVRTGSLRS